MGRWRLAGQDGSRWVTGAVDLDHLGERVWRLRYRTGIAPFDSADPDSARIYWDDPGVHQNLAFAVQADPISGMHCWHQRIRVEPAPRTATATWSPTPPAPTRSTATGWR